MQRTINKIIDQLGTVCLLLALAAAVLFAEFRFGMPQTKMFLPSLSFSWQWLVLGAIVTPPFMFVMGIVKALQVTFIGTDDIDDDEEDTEDEEEEETNAASFLRKAKSALFAVLSGGPEELLFRAILVPLVGVTLSSLLFAAAHVDSRRDVPYGVFCLIYGLILGTMFLVTGNIWPCVVTHILNNYVAGAHPEIMYAHVRRCLSLLKACSPKH